MSKLTPKQEAFVLEYLRTFSAAGAARAAGYSPRTARQTGAENLAKPYIRARIEALKAGRFAQAAMAAQEVLEELTLLARVDIAAFLEVGAGGAVRVKSFADMPPGASRCIRKIRQRTTRRVDPADPEGGPLLEVTTEIELWSKEEALTQLARYHGLLSGPNEEGLRPVTMNVTFTDAQPPAIAPAPSGAHLPRPSWRPAPEDSSR